MKLFAQPLPYDHNLLFISDKHTGSQLSSDNGWEEMCDVVHSVYDGCRNNYVIEIGDLIEGICVDDRRFSPEMLKNKTDEEGQSLSLPMVQVEEAIKEREPIAEKYLYINDGNHERTLWKYGNIGAQIAKGLGVPFGTYSSKVTIKDMNGKLMYKVFTTHGRRGITTVADDPIRQEANMQLTLKRHLFRKWGDCAVMVKAHTHKLLVSHPRKQLYIVDQNDRAKQKYTEWKQDLSFIHPDARWYGSSGSFLKLYGEGFSGYGEVAEYDPMEMGFLILRVRDRKIVSLDKYYLGV